MHLQTIAAIETLYRAILEEPAFTRIHIGLTGITLPENTTVHLPWGILRNVTPKELNFAERFIEGSLSHTNSGGVKTKIHYSGDAVLEFQIPYKIKICTQAQIDKSDVFKDIVFDFSDKIQAVKSALLISLDYSEETPFVVSSWIRIFDPLEYHSNCSWSDTKQIHTYRPRQLSSEEYRTWGEVIEKIDATNHNIGIAIDRTLRALIERTDPEDLLIDSVIAWENLFGGHGELTYRISSSFGHLLGEDFDSRLHIQSEIKKIYSLRGKIVHGDGKLKAKDLQFQKDTLSLSIKALKSLFLENDYLLDSANYKNGEARSNSLIMSEKQ